MTDQTARIAEVIEPVGGLHWDQRLLDLLAGALDLGLTSADCEDARRVLRGALALFGAEVAADLLTAQQAECASLREQVAHKDAALDTYHDWRTQLEAECATFRRELATANVEHTRAVLHYTFKGYMAGENADAKHWRARAEAAEAALSTLQTQLRHALHYMRCDSDCAGPWPHRPDHCACGQKAIRAEAYALLPSKVVDIE